MDRKVGGTTIVAALLLLIGAVLLMTQWPARRGGAMALSSPLYLVTEIALYLGLLLLLDRGLTKWGYAVGAACALGLRLGMGFAAAGLDYLRAGDPFDARLFPAVFSLPRVVIAFGTTAAVLVLLRDLLPQRRRPAAGPAARPAQAPAHAAKSEREPRLAFSAERAAGGSPRRSAEVMVLDERPPLAASAPAPASRSEPVFEGQLELPLSALLRDAPEQVAVAEGQAGIVARLPMTLIGPQLAQGRVAVPLGVLVECVPLGTVDVSGLDLETEVALPLDLVVAALPAGTLDPGPPAPPAWQCDLESEEALFSAA
jgi:hypothetical protein